jgi:hypothetical protein
MVCFISRKDLIEGLISWRFQNIPQVLFDDFYEIYNKTYTNDYIATEYYKIRGGFIRQITNNTFISLT